MKFKFDGTEVNVEGANDFHRNGTSRDTFNVSVGEGINQKWIGRVWKRGEGEWGAITQKKICVFAKYADNEGQKTEGFKSRKAAVQGLFEFHKEETEREQTSDATPN